MPKPNEGESRDEFVSRCIPIVLDEGTAQDQEQAAAICNSMYERKAEKLSVEQVAKLCPKCAEQMKAANIKAISLDALIKQGDPDRICGDIWSNGTDEQRSAFGSGPEGRGRDEQPPSAWWDDCTGKVEQPKARKAEPPKVRKSVVAKNLGVDLENRTVRHYITTTSIDDDGEVLLPRGADLTRFKKGGTVFDVHEYGTKNVIGRAMDLEVSDQGIIALTRFSPRPPSLPENVEWFPDTSLWLHHLGDISGWSVGLDPTETRPPTKKDINEFGDADHFKRVVTRWRLLEYSQAPLPTNEDAVNLARKGIISERLAEKLADGRPTMSLVREFSRPKPKRVMVMVDLSPPAPDVKAEIGRAVELVVARKRGKIHA